MYDPYELLAREIIIAALKDYAGGDPMTRQDVCLFIEQPSTVFGWVSVASGTDPEQLRERLKKRLKELETGGEPRQTRQGLKH